MPESWQVLKTCQDSGLPDQFSMRQDKQELSSANHGKGKILRVKTGYNPNSSSVGSQIPAFFAFAVGSGVLTILVLQILNAADKHLRQKQERPECE